MNKYDMTLREINHMKPLVDYDMGYHVSKGLNKVEKIYNHKTLDDLGEEDIILLLQHKIMPEEIVGLSLEILGGPKYSNMDMIPLALLTAISIQDKSFWNNHPQEKKSFIHMIRKYDERINLAKYHMDLIDIEVYRAVEKLS